MTQSQIIMPKKGNFSRAPAPAGAAFAHSAFKPPTATYTIHDRCHMSGRDTFARGSVARGAGCARDRSVRDHIHTALLPLSACSSVLSGQLGRRRLSRRPLCQSIAEPVASCHPQSLPAARLSLRRIFARLSVLPASVRRVAPRTHAYTSTRAPADASARDVVPKNRPMHVCLHTHTRTHGAQRTRAHTATTHARPHTLTAPPPRHRGGSRRTNA